MGPLSHLTVIDCGRFVAGPFAATLLADFGATVIKVEHPQHGDELRRLGPITDGRSLWWKVEARNKKCITLDLKSPEGGVLFKRLVEKADVVIESFRPGTLEKWGLGYDVLSRVNPRLIMLRVTGYGQTGPYIHRPGFNTTAESMGGLRFLIGDPDRPPARPGVALGDYLGGLFGALGVLMAVVERDSRTTGSDRGQVVDMALYEGVMRVLEHTIAAYDRLGIVRTRVGAGSAGTVPARAYLSADRAWVGLAAPSDLIFRKLCTAIGQPALAEDPKFATNHARIQNRVALDEILETWVASLPAAEVIAILEEHDVPVQKVYTVEDIFADPHIRDRGVLVDVPDPHLSHVRMQGVVPRLSRTPGEVRSTGPDLGAHNDEVYGGLLGLSPDEVAQLRARGVI